MSQSKLHSFYEQLVRIGIKIVIVNFLFYPIMFPSSSKKNNFLATLISVLLSTVIGYLTRRGFNKFEGIK